MADLTRTVEIVFGATSTVGSTLTGLTSEMDRFDAAVQGIAQPIANFTEGLLKIEAAVAAVAVAFSAAAIIEAGKFADSVLRIGTNVGGTADQMVGFRDQILAFARDSGSSIEDISAALYDLTSTGLSFEDAMVAMAEAERLAAVGMTDVGTATDLLTTAMGAYGATAEDTERFSAALFLTVRNGKMTIDELAQNFGKVAPAAAAAKVPIEDVGAAISALSLTMPVAQSITYLAGVFNELLDPGEELKAAMGGLRIETDGLKPVMDRLRDVTGGQAAEFLKLFANTESARGAMVLANDNAGVFAKTLGDMGGKTEAIAQAYELMAGSFERNNQRVINNLKATLIDMGLPMLDEYGDAAKALGSIFEGISIGFDAGAFDPVYAALETLFARITEVLASIGTNIPDALMGVDWTEFMAALEGLGDALYRAFVEVFGEIDLTTVEGLNQALQTLVDMMTALTNWTAGVVEGLRPVFQAIGEGVDQLKAANPEVAKATGEFTGAITVLGTLGTHLGGILVTLSGLGVEFSNVSATLAGAAQIIGNSLQLAFDAVAKTLVDLVGVILKVADALSPDIFVDLTDEIATLDQLSASIEAHWNDNIPEWEAGWRKLGDGLSGAAAEGEKTAAAAGKINTEMSGTKAVVDDTTGALEAFGGGLKYGSDEMVGYASALEGLATPLEDTVEPMGKMATATIEFGDGVKSALPTLADLKGTVIGVREEHGKYYATLVDANGATREQEVALNSATGAHKEMAKSTAATKDTTLEATKAANDFAVKMEQIASNERIRNIEAHIELNVAQIEAETEQVKAAFESMNVTIESTADVIGSIIDAMNGEAGKRDWWLFKELLLKEYELREKTVEKQMEMISAYIKLIEARTEATKKGDALFKIEAGGLSAHLEKILWELLKAIQLRATEEGAQWLVGCSGIGV